MNAAGDKSWGEHALTLNLPAVSIRLEGLSRRQQSELRETYDRFLPHPDAPADITCKIYRLGCGPAISQEELTLDGQYAPRKDRQSSTDSLHITGNNFQARLVLNGYGVSSLGIVNEKELAYANVIENYLRILSAHKVLQYGGVVLHSAGLIFDGMAYLFCGRSNSGKTTLTRKAYSAGAAVLSDDINLVLPGGKGYQAYAVPFTGEFGRTLTHAGGKKAYPLAGIILLEQGEQLRTQPVKQSQAVARLLCGCPFVNTDELESEALFDSVTALVSNMPVIRLVNRRNDTITAIMEAVQHELALLRKAARPTHE